MAIDHPIIPGVSFKDIERFPGYCVGDDGSVWSNHHQSGGIREWHRLRPGLLKRGYLQVRIYRDGKVYQIKVHTLVLEAFVSPRPVGMEACHFPDRDPSNNRAINLRWGTTAENSFHCKIHGTDSSGMRNGRAKLSNRDVAEIRRLFSVQVNKQDKRTLAARFGISPTMIRYIVTGKSWKESI